MLSSSKWPSEPQFCESFNAVGEKIARNTRKLANLLLCHLHFKSEFRSKQSDDDKMFFVKELTVCLFLVAAKKLLRTEVRGYFNIHGTKYFKNAIFHQKSKIYDVVSLLYLWLAKQPVLSMKYWHGWLLLKDVFSILYSSNQLC